MSKRVPADCARFVKKVCHFKAMLQWAFVAEYLAV
jgi:hypothetical protein